MTPLPAADKWFTESNEASGSEQGTWQNSHILESQYHLTLLVVGTAKGQVLLYTFGLVHCATVDVAAEVPGTIQILDAQFSGDMNMLSVVVERRLELAPLDAGAEENLPAKDVAHVVVDTTVVAERHRELFTLAHKYAEIQALFNYSADAVTQLREAWEGVLLEMDTKLDAYSGKRGTGEVSNDFLELLVIGYAEPEFHMFLTDKLTEKGLKKLRQSVELSYTNMHKLVVKQLEAVGQGLVFVLGQVLGMARTKDRYDLLGVDEVGVNTALKEAGAFLLKTSELQQVILVSMKYFLAFLKWLSCTHLRISGSNVPQELAKTTNEEQTDVFNFISSIEDIVIDNDGQQHRQFKLESVGQYLQDADLSSPLECESNPWLKFLIEHPEVSKLPLILPQRRKTSLIQEHNILSKELTRLANTSIETIGKNIKISQGNSLFSVRDETCDVIITQRSQDSTHKMHLMAAPNSKSLLFYFFQWDTDVNEIYFQATKLERRDKIYVAAFNFSQNILSLNSPSKSTDSDNKPETNISAGQFYNGDMVSVIFEDSSTMMRSLFVQVRCSSVNYYNFHLIWTIYWQCENR